MGDAPDASSVLSLCHGARPGLPGMHDGVHLTKLLSKSYKNDMKEKSPGDCKCNQEVTDGRLWLIE